MSTPAEIFSKEVHRKVIRKFPRRRVIVNGMDNVWSVDLSDMQTVAEFNSGYKYILCVVDVFTKYAWAVPLKNKTGPTILSEFKKIISESRRAPQIVWVDKGSEFYNKDFIAWTKSQNIKMYSTYSESKSVIVERFQRTLKNMIFTYFTEHNTRNWIDILPSFIKKYNHHVHSTIGMSPIDATKQENQPTVFELHKHIETKMKEPKFKIGDKVRISRQKGVFEKGFDNNFSYEVFNVTDVLPTDPVTYRLSDYHNEPIEGSFYTQELLKTQVPDYYLVEKVLKTRTVGKRKEYLVKYMGWNKRFNEWLPEDQMSDIK